MTNTPQDDTPQIWKIMQAWTGNITPATGAMLDVDHDSVPVTYPKRDYGWFVTVPEEDADDFLLKDCPSDLKEMIELARKHDCQWIEIDQDNDPVPGLPEYEW